MDSPTPGGPGSSCSRRSSAGTKCWRRRSPDMRAGRLAGTATPPAPPLVDAIERALDEAGFDTAHVVGNSLGGYLALQLAARGRADSSWRSRPPAAGPGPTTPSTRRSTTSPRCMTLLKSLAPLRRRDRQHPGGPAPRHRVHQLPLRAHPARPARPPDLRGRRLQRARAAARARPAPRLAARRRADRVPRADRCGAPRTGCCRGRPVRCATATTCSPTPTGSCSTASGTARSSTSRSRPPS